VSLPGFITAIDFETTSINNPRATEIGLVALDDDLNPVAKFETLLKPPRSVESRSLLVSRLSLEQINSANSFVAHWSNIHPFLNNRVIVAHNAEFKMKVLQAELEEIGITTIPPCICTCLLARKIYPKIPTHRLRFLGTVLDVDSGSLASTLKMGLNPRRALSDALVCGGLLKVFISRKPVAVQDQIAKAQIITHSYQEPDRLLTPPMLRKSFETYFRNENHAFETFEEIISSGKKQVELTGKSRIGESAFIELLESVGFFYKDKTTDSRNTAFIVKSKLDADEETIREATEAGIPVLREEEFHYFVNLVKELGA
jgi:DNA polymerase-3 subunit epsilon